LCFDLRDIGKETERIGKEQIEASSMTLDGFLFFEGEGLINPGQTENLLGCSGMKNSNRNVEQLEGII